MFCLLLAGPATALADTSATPEPTGTPSYESGLRQPDSLDAFDNLLGDEGVTYYPVESVQDATPYQGKNATLVIDSSEYPDNADLQDIKQAGFGRIIILDNTPAVLNALAPGVTLVDSAAVVPERMTAHCSQADAAAAGILDPVGQSTGTFAVSAAAAADGATGCFPVLGAASLVDVPPGSARSTASAGSTSSASPTASTRSTESTTTDVIVLGSDAYFSESQLGDAGNAALGLRLFGAHSTLVWLAPSFQSDQSLLNCGGALCGGGNSNGNGGGNGGGNPNPQPGQTITQSPQAQNGSPNSANPPTLVSLMPKWVWWVLLQLIIAVALLGLWRGRRVGRVVTEELPVTVRAAETVEGHARLYRRAGAHARAAQLLRQATAGRLAGYFGLPAERALAEPSLLVKPVAERLGRSEEAVAAVLTGDAPAHEAELVQLADRLDQLEKEVRSS